MKKPKISPWIESNAVGGADVFEIPNQPERQLLIANGDSMEYELLAKTEISKPVSSVTESQNGSPLAEPMSLRHPLNPSESYSSPMVTP
jgi:hypothetical protein